MMAATLPNLRFCAYCPNPCRSALEDDTAYLESQTPSALALLAVLVEDRALAWSADVDTALADDSVAVRCRERCPYGYDIPAELAAFRRDRAGGA